MEEAEVVEEAAAVDKAEVVEEATVVDEAVVVHTEGMRQRKISDEAEIVGSCMSL